MNACQLKNWRALLLFESGKLFNESSEPMESSTRRLLRGETMKNLKAKNIASTLLLSALMSVPFSAQAEGDWWEKTKQTASEAWDSTTETVSGWTKQAKESETMQSVKEGTSEVVDTMSDKQTYIKAWEATKETAGEAKEKVVKAYEEAKTTNDTPASGE